jgi:hypothetical protein
MAILRENVDVLAHEKMNPDCAEQALQKLKNVLDTTRYKLRL